MIVYIETKDFCKFRIYGNKVQVRINEHEEAGYMVCDEIMLPCFDKNMLISGLIKANYPSDIMDAVRNNYELVRDGTAGDKTEEYTEEYNKMQAWRAYSKQLASEIINSKSNNI